MSFKSIAAGSKSGSQASLSSIFTQRATRGQPVSIRVIVAVLSPKHDLDFNRYLL